MVNGVISSCAAVVNGGICSCELVANGRYAHVQELSMVDMLMFSGGQW